MKGVPPRPKSPALKSIGELLARFEGVSLARGGDLGLTFSGVSLNSREVIAGDLYVGMRGVATHGANFWPDASAAGAGVLLTDPDGLALAPDAPLVLVVDDPRALLGELSAWLYDTSQLDLTLFGVTGTDGKTSVVYLLSALAEALGQKSGLSSTAQRRVGELVASSALTTPEANELHALLSLMAQEGVQAGIIEVSAQALTRHRVDGVMFDVVGFTNLSHDHLDDYGDMESYFLAKKELFSSNRARAGVVNIDTPWGERLALESDIATSTLSLSKPAADWYVHDVQADLDGTTFTITRRQPTQSLTLRLPLVGEYMAENAALAVAMVATAGADLSRLAAALPGGMLPVKISGRMERVSNARPAAFIDFGHTPAAFSSTLSSLRQMTSGKLILVFSLSGNRDTSKRHEIGEIAAKGADILIVTDLSPRFEDPAVIRQALIAGARDTRPEVELYEIPDPSAALRKAIGLAGDDDVVLFTGSGHRSYRDVMGKKIPYSAQDDLAAALAERGAAL